MTFGARVRVADEDTDEETDYTIVGPYEADINAGLISTMSPIATPISTTGTESPLTPSRSRSCTRC